MAEECQNGSGVENRNADGAKILAIRPKIVVQAPRAADAVAFYKAAFGAEEVERSIHPKRKADHDLPLILYTRLRFGDVELLVSDETDESGTGVKSVETLGGTPFVLCVETEDVQGAVARAVKEGAVVEEAAGDGLCCGGGCWTTVKDPFGFVWAFGSPSKVTTVDVDA